MTSEIKNSMKNEESNEIKIEDLTPRMKHVDLIFKVVEKSEVREIISRRTYETHRIVDATIGDETGIVKFPLWDDNVERVEEGKSYKIENGYTGLFRGNLQVKIGHYSELKEAEIEIEDVNLDVDMSAKDHRTSRPRHYYQPYEGTGKGPEVVYRERSFGRTSRRNRNNSRRNRW